MNVASSAVNRQILSLEAEIGTHLFDRLPAGLKLTAAGNFGWVSAFIGQTLRRALDEARRWDDIEAGIGALAGREHEWDADPAAWVHAQRFGDTSRVG